MVRYYGTQDERRAHRHKWRELLRNGLENAETTSSKLKELQILLTTYEVLFAFFKLFIVSPKESYIFAVCYDRRWLSSTLWLLFNYSRRGSSFQELKIGQKKYNRNS